MNINEAIKEQRLSKNLSLMDVEKATGIGNGSLCRWENGQVSPSITFCIKLAQFYGCTLDELVGLTDLSEQQRKKSLPMQPQNKAVAFTTEYSELIEDNNFRNIAKLCRDITPELRALALGYLVGLLQNNGVNTKKILGY